MLEQCGIVHRDRGLRGNALDDRFMVLCKSRALRMAEKQAAQNLSRTRHHRDS